MFRSKGNQGKNYGNYNCCKFMLDTPQLAAGRFIK